MDSRPLHIGVDGRELMGRPTGVGRWVDQLVRAWATTQTPHRVSVFAPVPVPESVAQVLVGRHRWVVAAPGAHGTWWEQRHLPTAIRKANVDVWFAPGYTAPAFLACPMVPIIHDVSFMAHPEWFGWREGGRRRLLTRRTAQRAACIIAPSRFSAGEIARHCGVPLDRIVVVPPGLPTTLTPAAQTAPQTPREPLVLSVGSLFNRRHIDRLISAFAATAQHVDGARLVVVGDNRTRPELDPHALARAAGIANRFKWLTYADDTVVADLYARARVFAFLSSYEGFAMTPLEALAHGVPSVLLDTPVAREVYGDGAALVPLDDTAIASALTRLTTDDGAHAALLAKATPLLSRYQWAPTADRILRVLEEAARTR